MVRGQKARQSEFGAGRLYETDTAGKFSGREGGQAEDAALQSRRADKQTKRQKSQTGTLTNRRVTRQPRRERWEAGL